MGDTLKIVIASIKGWERDYMAEHLDPVWDVKYFEAGVDDVPQEALSEAQVLSTFIGSPVDRELLDRCPNLKLVTTRSTGFDHIDLQATAERGIVVTNVPEYGDNTVAEHCFGLILALSRNIYTAVQRAKQANLSIEGLMGFDLNGKTLGVVGAGRIGLHVIRIGRALNMRALAFDIQPQRLLSEVLGFEYVSLDELLQQSDVVSLHVPLNRHTHHLINAEKLAMMKPGAILVNTSRGAVVDSMALLERLSSGHLAGAALDVLEAEEVLTEDCILGAEECSAQLDKLRLAVEAYQLLHHPKVLVTPHIAFYSREALQRILLTTVENIRGFVEGKPVNVVQEAGG